MKLFWRIILIGVLVFNFSQLQASHTDTLQVFSPQMNKEIPVLVVQPTHGAGVEIRYPVLYLLHGYSGNHLSWQDLRPDLGVLADQYQMIFVMPDGGYDSWYLDSPINPKVRYESFFVETLIPKIDSTYPTIPDRQHRGITGLSMGGHGALFLSIRHQDLFGVVSSMSGGVDLRPFPDNWNLKAVLGDAKTYAQNWNDYSVINLAENLKDGDLRIFLDDGVDDFFLQENRALHQKLLDRKIAHDYIEKPGAHQWKYWKRALPYHLLFFKEYFDQPVIEW